ncbi:hypothetical protein [Microbacterium caowuchunii]|uniref:DUF2283 domain-containing protein n=1 Tax=Microbacterium caowuchunii TaxID=2614638 RepID=A0A5N0TL48_9MICO|nr:hypothetical protein [Microbacterium caowuchunii]KAA9134867.1 hypothetical protein F6B40_04005 [Microbacterium caowuchunii]
MPERGFDVDRSPDSAYLPIATSIGAGETVVNMIIQPAHGTLVLDFHADGRLLGAEVLGAQALLTAETIADAEALT